MNHIKNFINTNIPCRNPSNIRITTHHTGYKCELGNKKRSIKPRSPKIGNSFMLVMRQFHPNLVKTRREGIRIGVDKSEGISGIRSKSMASLIKRFLSDKKLPLQCNLMKNVNPKQEVTYNNTPCYDCNINYEGDRETRSYAQMITAYNNTLMTIDNSSNMIRDKLKSKMNVKLSKTHFRTTSTLSSSAYNLENLMIKENSKETLMTDLSNDTSFDHSVEIDDFYDKDEDRNDLEISKSEILQPEITTTRSYANIIADYSAAMNKNKNHLSKLSMVSYPEKIVTSDTSDCVLSSNLNTDSSKEININEEIDWVRRVDKVVKNLKSATARKDKKIDLKETNVSQCVTIDKAVKVDKMKSTEMTPRKIHFPGNNKNEESLKHCQRKEKVDGIKMVGQCLSSDYKFSTSSNVNSTFGKNLTQMPNNTESNISNDPQVELRMVPSGNESIVSVNVDSIGKTTESRNPSSKELSVVVSSNNKHNLSNALATNLKGENQSNFGTMRISISEESLPVKELELFINGKPISDVRSIKARTETLNVLTSMDKVEIRVPYSQDNPNTLNQSPKNLVKNISNPESVLKLRIATAFDETNPIMTSGDTKKVQHLPTDLQSKSSQKKSTRIEESNFNVIMSELSSTINKTNESNVQEMSTVKIEKSDEVNVKKTFKSDTIQEKQSIKSENDSMKRPNSSSMLTSVHDNVKKHEIPSDIDLRLTKTFGGKTNVKNNSNVKQDESLKQGNIPNESYKRANLSTKDNIRSLADIMIRHSGRSSDGNSSALSGKPKSGDSNQINDHKSSKSDKHDTKTTDAMTKKFILNNQSSKSDSLDEHVSLKQSTRLSDVKSKKEEDYQRNYSTPTYVTNKQKSTESNRTLLVSNDKIQSKLKVDSLDEKMSSTNHKWNKPSIEMKTSKVEKQLDTKDSKTFSKVPDVEKTSKSSSTFKSENVRITRDDFFLFNEETTSRSSSNPVKIVEFEKFDKRNEVSFKKGEAKNVATSKESENVKRTVVNEKKGNVQIQMKEVLPKSDVVVRNIDTKINESKQNVDNVRNEKFVRCKLTSFEEKSNLRMNDKKDSSNDLEKQRKSTNDSKMKNIFNSMKPIEKKKDGILIDYGVKVASRKKQEKTKSPKQDLKLNENNPIVTTTNEKIKEKENQCLNNRDEIKTIQSTPVSIENPIKNNPKKVELKAMKKVTNETKSFKCDDIKEKHLNSMKKDIDSNTVNLDKINNESLNVKLSKTLDKLKENLSHQNVNESKQCNFINNSTAKEESTKNSKDVTTAKRSAEEFRVPYEGTVVQNPSKSLSTGHQNLVMEPLAGTIVRRPSKELEKKKPKNTSHKYSSKSTRENGNKKENQRESSYSVNLLEDDTNKNKCGSKNHLEKPSSPVNSNNSSSFDKTKSYSTTSIDLIKSNISNKRDCEEKNKQNNAKTRDKFVNKLKRPEKDLVYSVWLQRQEDTADDKTS